MNNRHLHSLDGHVASMNRQRAMVGIWIFVCLVLWGIVLADYWFARNAPEAVHYLTPYYIADMVIFQASLWLALVRRNLLGVLIMVPLVGFYVWAYEETKVLLPQQSASQAAHAYIKELQQK